MTDQETDGMINYEPSSIQSAPLEHGESTGSVNPVRESIAALDASLSQLHQAKRNADESLRRAQDAPGPHTSDNSIFVSLWEAHLGDRELLFSAMRQLDRVRQVLPPGGAAISEPANGRKNSTG
ncbi:MAG TPA: hypothetical protein VGV39_06920 [Mesorhizobium sp.]|jgi:hypothetical protein|uniref:hypothetical protein n=1 Tax=Mesorhizobium sp. TaxID=1871066 RepID=UPI002DDD4769|nr:hypothetical protein [Mesorhizobium sp.]HEV2502789.1 hypothetical protein [Mesorhizobium sp.]